MSDLKRFDDYTAVVDCNECSHYWDSSCDGVSKGSSKPCNSFVATRKVVIPQKVNRLEESVNDLTFHVVMLYLALFLYLGVEIWRLFNG